MLAYPPMSGLRNDNIHHLQCWQFHQNNLTSPQNLLSIRIRAVSPEPSLFALMKYGSRRRVRPESDI